MLYLQYRLVLKEPFHTDDKINNNGRQSNEFNEYAYFGIIIKQSNEFRLVLKEPFHEDDRINNNGRQSNEFTEYEYCGIIIKQSNEFNEHEYFRIIIKQ